MDYLKNFIIPFKGLGIGNHKFTFVVDDLFFEKIEYSEIKKGKINVELLFEKQENMFVLNFQIDGNIQVKCDRCSDDFYLPIKGDQQLFIQFGNSFEEKTDEIIIIPRNDFEIDLAPYIYEYIILILPIQRLHINEPNGKSQCNQAMLDRLNQLSEREHQSDPRWDALKKLKTKIIK